MKRKYVEADCRFSTTQRKFAPCSFVSALGFKSKSECFFEWLWMRQHNLHQRLNCELALVKLLARIEIHCPFIMSPKCLSYLISKLFQPSNNSLAYTRTQAAIHTHAERQPIYAERVRISNIKWNTLKMKNTVNPFQA